MGSPCLFTRQRAHKMGYFKSWLPERKKIYIESKASFIDISSIASFKLFLVAWLPEYCTFWTVQWLALGPGLGQNTSSGGLFSKKKSCSAIKLFFVFKYVLYYTVLSNYLKKKFGVTVLV